MIGGHQDGGMGGKGLRDYVPHESDEGGME